MQKIICNLGLFQKTCGSNIDYISLHSSASKAYLLIHISSNFAWGIGNIVYKKISLHHTVRNFFLQLCSLFYTAGYRYCGTRIFFLDWKVNPRNVQGFSHINIRCSIQDMIEFYQVNVPLLSYKIIFYTNFLFYLVDFPFLPWKISSSTWLTFPFYLE